MRRAECHWLCHLIATLLLLVACADSDEPDARCGTVEPQPRVPLAVRPHVEAGALGTCFLDSSGSVTCWGCSGLQPAPSTPRLSPSMCPDGLERVSLPGPAARL